MTADEIRCYLVELDEELRRIDVKGEVSIYGGAVMCLVYDARPATKDVDAVFKPASEIKSVTKLIADRHQLPPDWLNDGVKGYLVQHDQPHRSSKSQGVCSGPRLPFGNENFVSTS